MIANLKAELRKIFTVRSTYLITLFALLIAAGLVGFWVYGYKNVDHVQTSPHALYDSLLSAVSTAGVFVSFVAILLAGHEYRYNTIMYSLTSSNSRTKVFLAKLAMLLVFALGFGALAALLNGAAVYLGWAVHGLHPVSQQVPLGTLAWHSAVTMVGNATYAYIITMLLRNLIGAFAVVLVLPTTVETILGLILHDNTKYLPYTALSNLTTMTPKVSQAFSAGVVCAYAVVFGLLAYLLFVERDAN